MLQNFEDLEQASSSKAALWLFIGKDLMISLISSREGQMKSLNTLTAYVIGVLIVWAVIFTVGYFRSGSTVGHPVLHVYCDACLSFQAEGSSYVMPSFARGDIMPTGDRVGISKY
jgi:hypothetical protein